jgi:hypothetical protein
LYLNGRLEKTSSGKASEFICSTKYNDQVREDEMGMTCSTMANEKFIQISTYR